MDGTSKKDLSVQVGFVTIYLPDYTMSNFMIAESLADKFGVETNKQAINKLREALRGLEDDLPKKVKPIMKVESIQFSQYLYFPSYR